MCVFKIKSERVSYIVTYSQSSSLFFSSSSIKSSNSYKASQSISRLSLPYFASRSNSLSIHFINLACLSAFIFFTISSSAWATYCPSLLFFSIFSINSWSTRGFSVLLLLRNSSVILFMSSSYNSSLLFFLFLPASTNVRIRKQKKRK